MSHPGSCRSVSTSVSWLSTPWSLHPPWFARVFAEALKTGRCSAVSRNERGGKKRLHDVVSGFVNKGFTAYRLTTSFGVPKLRFVPEMRLFLAVRRGF